MLLRFSSYKHAIANIPAQMRGAHVVHFPRTSSLPRPAEWVGLRITIFGTCSAFTRVMACLLAKSPYVTFYTRGFNRFVTSTIAPVATDWNDSCRAGFAPAEEPRLCTAHCWLWLGPLRGGCPSSVRSI